MFRPKLCPSAPAPTIGRNIADVRQVISLIYFHKIPKWGKLNEILSFTTIWGRAAAKKDSPDFSPVASRVLAWGRFVPVIHGNCTGPAVTLNLLCQKRINITFLICRNILIVLICFYDNISANEKSGRWEVFDLLFCFHFQGKVKILFLLLFIQFTFQKENSMDASLNKIPQVLLPLIYLQAQSAFDNNLGSLPGVDYILIVQLRVSGVLPSQCGSWTELSDKKHYSCRKCGHM